MKPFLYIFLFFAASSVYAQKSICITIDDVPHTSTELLSTIESLGIPVTIFISENKLYKNDSLDSNQLARLNDWVQYPKITLGNHTNGHPHYSKIGFDAFSKTIVKGEEQTLKLLEGDRKRLKHFRFPFNDLGADSLQQDSIIRFLNDRGYQISPFTLESADYLFNYIYSYYLKESQPEKAKTIGDTYVNFTIELLHFMDSVVQKQYGRDIPHIYLCHDNPLNKDFLPALIKAFKQSGYSIDDYEHVLEDEIYSNTNFYYRKYGVSWIYRWMESRKDRQQLMRIEPLLPDSIERDHKRIREIRK